MKLLKIVDRKDGSADVDFQFTEKEEQFLIQFAVNKILQEHIAHYHLPDFKVNKNNKTGKKIV